MKRPRCTIRLLARSHHAPAGEAGQTLVEYGLIICLVSVAMIVGMVFVWPRVNPARGPRDDSMLNPRPTQEATLVMGQLAQLEVPPDLADQVLWSQPEGPPRESTLSEDLAQLDLHMISRGGGTGSLRVIWPTRVGSGASETITAVMSLKSVPIAVWPRLPTGWDDNSPSDEGGEVEQELGPERINSLQATLTSAAFIVRPAQGDSFRAHQGRDLPWGWTVRPEEGIQGTQEILLTLVGQGARGTLYSLCNLRLQIDIQDDD